MARNQLFTSQIRLPIFIGIAALSLAGILAQLEHIRGFDWRLYDYALSQRQPTVFENVVLVGVTNSDVSWLDQPFPWSRDQQSVIFEKIASQKPRAVAVDFLYTEPSSAENDLRLGRELAACGKLAGAFYFDTGPPPGPAETELLKASGNLLGANLVDSRWPRPPHQPKLPVANVAAGMTRVGHAITLPDPDGITRRIPLLASDGQRLYPALALQGVLLHWGADWSQIRATPREITIVGLPGQNSIRIPLDGKGNFLAPFPVRTDERFVGVSVQQLMTLEDELPEMDDKLVFVGSLLTGHGDIYPTPVEPATAGLMINAAVAGLILQEEFVTPARWWMEALLAAVALLFICGLVALKRPILSLLLSLILLAGIVGLSIWLLIDLGRWIPPSFPVLAGALGAFALTIQSFVAVETQRKNTFELLSRFLSPALAAKLAKDPNAMNRKPVRKELSVFFSDIVDYTNTSERLEPEDLFSVLDQYYNAMTEVAYRHHGTVNKYLGDGMMVFFNDPVAQEDHALLAVRMAVDMQRALSELNRRLEEQGLPSLQARMGVCTGYATVGNVGSGGFVDYTAIGPTVNLAARVMNLAGGGEIYLSEKTLLGIQPGEFDFEDLGPKPVKGFSEPVRVYRADT